MAENDAACFKKPENKSLPEDRQNCKVFTLSPQNLPGINDAEYSMKYKYRGKAIFFNHSKYLRSHTERLGAAADETNIKVMFKKLGFDVKVYPNFRKHDIENLLNEGKIQT